MKDLAGATLIAKEIGIDCMDIKIKLTQKLSIMSHKPYSRYTAPNDKHECT